jgi:hypothetical protein
VLSLSLIDIDITNIKKYGSALAFHETISHSQDFDAKYGKWGYVYHGTEGKHVGSILKTGFKGSQGLCFCGKDDVVVYTSPSIEYSAHPRYASVGYNPKTRLYMQAVLQCRANPDKIWKKKQETLYAEKMKIDPHIKNDNLEWLLRANYTDPKTGLQYLQDGLVCTAVMIRVIYLSQIKRRNKVRGVCSVC